MEKWLKDTLDFFRLAEETIHLRKLYTQGDLFQILVTGQFHMPPPKNPPRVIHTFSHQARLRLLKYSATINWKKTRTSLYATWTYPDEVLPRDRLTLNRDRYLLMRKIEKHLGRRLCGIWRIEWKPRLTGKFKGQAMPHWHWIVFDVGYISYKKIRLYWREVIHAPNEVSMRFERIEDGQKATRYIGKYAAKAINRDNLDILPQLNSLGRHYGYFRKAQIPRHKVQWFKTLTAQQLKAIQEYASQNFEWLDPRTPRSFSLFGNYGVAAVMKILEMGVAKDGNAM